MLEFRGGNVLATRFTGTLSERYGSPQERIPTPDRLCDWLDLNGLTVRTCSSTQLETAVALREAIHESATAAALGRNVPDAARTTINACSEQGSASRHLSPDQTFSWRLRSHTVEDALSVVATDAIELLAGGKHGRIALCAAPTCRAAFLDTSQSRSRKWCDMNTCGNREKKARLKDRSRRS